MSLNEIFGFVKGTIYELVDYAGLCEHQLKHGIYTKWLPHHIKQMGNTILILNADAHGNAFGIRFGDGTIYANEPLSAEISKFFKPLSPLAVEAVLPKPDKVMGVEIEIKSNIIKFPKKEKFSVSVNKMPEHYSGLAQKHTNGVRIAA